VLPAPVEIASMEIAGTNSHRSDRSDVVHHPVAVAGVVSQGLSDDETLKQSRARARNGTAIDPSKAVATVESH
jgi:hypothetical protein